MDVDADGSLGRAMTEAATRDLASTLERQVRELRERIEALEFRLMQMAMNESLRA